MSINFGSTYEVSLSRGNQKSVNKKHRGGISPANKDSLKTLSESYKGYAPKYREGVVRFSCPKTDDNKVLKQLSKLGFLDFKMAFVHDIKNNEDTLDVIHQHGKKARINKGKLHIETPAEPPKRKPKKIESATGKSAYKAKMATEKAKAIAKKASKNI